MTAVTPTFTAPAWITRLGWILDSKPAPGWTLATTILVGSPRLLRNWANASPMPTFRSSALEADGVVLERAAGLQRDAELDLGLLEARPAPRPGP